MSTPDAVSPDIYSSVAEILASVTGVAEAGSQPDLRIRELGILDSLGVINLIVALGERFGLAIAPTEIEEEDLATPAAVARFVQGKLGSQAP